MITLKMHLDGDACWPDLKDTAREGLLIDTQSMEIALLVGGMSSGKASVAFRFDLSDGHVIFAQTSLELLENAVKAMKTRAELMAAQPQGQS